MHFKNLTIVDNPFIKRDLTILRNKNTQPNEFRLALKRISFSLAIAVSQNLEFAEIKVETPLEITTGYKLKNEVILVPVLRAGLSLVEPFLEMIPDANVGHIGLQRDEKTLKPVDYYYKTPKFSDKSLTILLDPMLATGGSASAAFNFLKERGAKKCMLVNLIAAPEGVLKLQNEHPDIPIYTASLDRQLNKNGYILPGLGDAGDRTFGTI
ncbi:uracil phosphoribosyltransferase [Melioribacteraceae bacterium 4301-Me]|uniref:uracil phosphoribosyltransferase n=1 Tax=Pyranulibacter aquaticus TaxID=3163344 RepID=UPI0035994172